MFEWKFVDAVVEMPGFEVEPEIYNRHGHLCRNSLVSLVHFRRSIYWCKRSCQHYQRNHHVWTNHDFSITIYFREDLHQFPFFRPFFIKSFSYREEIWEKVNRKIHRQQSKKKNVYAFLSYHQNKKGTYQYALLSKQWHMNRTCFSVERQSRR